ncbi:hypothetical protein [uncultured Tateyamaria sp.]|uniref:hypothetical protein n=1 Tax=Tateyamaria sp. 1078 TaxID=3417464 RepID=UPI00261D14DF|nr:hypothetical protein [uncultured Tateyamaria sp.]
MKKTTHRWLATCATATLGAAALPALADNVIADDLIVQFSACVGNDCVNGESFGFDTLRLKENNLRIHANDTSNSASFPTNDWRIVFNETGNGGANYFAVEDSDAGRIPFRVEAGAPAHALVVEDSGDIGMGTLTPVVNMHVVDGDSPTLRLEQDGSSGFTPQTFDIVSNEANFFVRDVTNGSQLPLRIQPGADTNALYIASDNDIGLGTNTPDDALNIERASGAVAIRFTSGASTAPNPLRLNFNTNQNEFRITYDGLGVNQFRLNSDGHLRVSGLLGVADGITAPGAEVGFAQIYVDSADGDLKVVFPGGTVRTIAND